MMISIDKPDKAAVIKWLRYVNIGLPVLAVLIVVVSLADSPKYSNRSLERESRSAMAAVDGSSNGIAQAGTKEDVISPLLAAAREFSLRMDPPPKPKPKPEPAILPKPNPEPKPGPAAIAAPIPVEEYGSLSISLAPSLEDGGWRVDGGPWQKSNAVVEKVKVGVHIVEFKPVGGFDILNSFTVQVNKDQLTRQEVTYNKSRPPKPPDPQVTLTGTIVRGAKDSIVWVRLPGKNKDSVYFTGDVILGYELTSVSNGSAVLAQNGYDFVVKMAPSTPQVSQPAGGQMAPPQANQPARGQMPPPPHADQPAKGQMPPPPLRPGGRGRVISRENP
jgi:hypothetical protein